MYSKSKWQKNVIATVVLKWQFVVFSNDKVFIVVKY